ncbi:hypothetical protein [Parasedimentitalea psychrophila]|uniref:Uncharacterized protein n=1 Tax=Parasedimentitalea psychrophila TaxID=2997337 RepID=A0A9Y2L1M2_9RHOB|nr:hypothetical protein [Parasedimentitalea psychrophila]WIY26379.1 hypothetical protein QPJ95_05550 [Parasedimentitalea psychrophila]
MAGLLAIALSQTACTAAVIATGAADPFYSAVDAAAERRLQEEYRQKYPGVDINDDYALGRAMFEEAKRDNPAQMGHLTMPSRSVWEANNAKVNGGAAASVGQSSAPVAAASAPVVSSSRVAQDQAALKRAGTPWATVSKSWPYDALNLSSVAPYACGIKKMQFSVNGGATKTQGFSSCASGAAKADPPYWTFDQNSIETVSVTMTFANGSRQTRNFTRDEIFQR